MNPIVDQLARTRIMTSDLPEKAFANLATQQAFPVMLLVASSGSAVTDEVSMRIAMSRLRVQHVSNSEHSIHRSNLTRFCEIVEDFLHTNNL